MSLKNLTKYFALLFLVVGCSSCATVPREQETKFKGDIALKEICQVHRISWNWDSVSQVITLEVRGKKVKGLVGSDVVLFDQDKIMLSKPIRIVQSTIIVPGDFKEKVIDRNREEKIVRPTEDFHFRRASEIILDAGHGGKDPGALGKRGTKEKSVVLDIALRVRRILDRNGIKTRMTRQSDVFISLQERTEIASRNTADLFVSIHANSNPSRSVQGMEVYLAPYLSNDDRNEDQRKENLKLLVRNLKMNKENNDLAKIVADMLYSYKQSQSSVLASRVASGTSHYADVKNRGVKHARFFVLRNTLIPAVLIEVGYLTNFKEEKLLSTKIYRQKIAHGIAESILNYVDSL